MRRYSRLAAALELGVVAVLLFLTTASGARPAGSGRVLWTSAERATLRSLSLASLAPLPSDPSNRLADDDAAATLGGKLFFDTRLSSNGKVSCGTCHLPELGFQDGVPLGVGVGTAGRRTMPIAGTAYSPWQFWDGRADSQWSQALGPLESPVEHGGDRVQYAHRIAGDYKREYESVFGKLPDLRGLPSQAGPVEDAVRRARWDRITPSRQEEITRVYANIGKAIAAFERRVRFTPSRFDRYVEAVLARRPETPADSFSADEEAGLRLFIGKASCTNCHNGALFTDDHFHNTGVPAAKGTTPLDSGRTVGARQVARAEFNCTSRYSDAGPADCAELKYAVLEGPELVRAFKTPSLRNAATRAPFMHAGQIATLPAVLSHYNRAPAAPAGTSELKPLRLSERELRQLEAFLKTLVSPLDVPSRDSLP